MVVKHFLRNHDALFCLFPHITKYTIRSIVCEASYHSVTRSLGHSVTRSLDHYLSFFQHMRLTNEQTTSGSTGLLRRQISTELYGLSCTPPRFDDKNHWVDGLDFSRSHLHHHPLNDKTNNMPDVFYS